MYSSRISSSICLLVSLFCIITVSNGKSIEPRTDRMDKISSIIQESINQQPIIEKNNTVNPILNKEVANNSDQVSDEMIMNIFRDSLDKLPGESMGKFVEKRSTYLNPSVIEALFESESNSVEIKDEPGCFIEIKIIKRIPGRCAIMNGEAVCKTDTYYKKNDECSFNV